MKVKSLSRVQFCVTPWTAAYQAPLSMGFSMQEYWSGVPLPSPPKMHNVFKKNKACILFIKSSGETSFSFGFCHLIGVLKIFFLHKSHSHLHYLQFCGFHFINMEIKYKNLCAESFWIFTIKDC